MSTPFQSKSKPNQGDEDEGENQRARKQSQGAKGTDKGKVKVPHHIKLLEFPIPPTTPYPPQKPSHCDISVTKRGTSYIC